MDGSFGGRRSFANICAIVGGSWRLIHFARAKARPTGAERFGRWIRVFRLIASGQSPIFLSMTAWALDDRFRAPQAEKSGQGMALSKRALQVSYQRSYRLGDSRRSLQYNNVPVAQVDRATAS
jgi:hypothetical protein